MKYRKIILSIVILLTVYSISVFIDFMLSGRKDARRLDAATRYFSSGNYDKARPALIKIVSADPGNEAACRMLASVYESEHNYQAAAVYYRQACALNPFDKSCRVKLAENLTMLGGSQDILKLLKADFNNQALSEEEVLYYLEALIVGGDQSGFARHLPALKTDSAPHLYLLYGIREMDNRQYVKALSIFGRLQKEDVSAAVRYRALAFSAVSAGMLKDDVLTEENLKAAAALNPVLGSFPLASFYLNQGKQTEALVQLMRCVKAAPGHALARLAIIDIYAQSKNIQRLKELLKDSAVHSRDEQQINNYLKASIAIYEKDYRNVLKFLDAAPDTAGRPGHQTMMFEALLAAQDIGRLPGCVNDLLRVVPRNSIHGYIESRLYPLLTELLQERRFTEADKVATVLLPATAPEYFSVAAPSVNMLLLSAMDRRAYGLIIDYAAFLLKKDPQNVMANLATGEALLAMGRPQDALTWLAKIPESLPVFYDQSRAWLMLKEDGKAESIYKRAWSRFPGDILLFEAYADFLFARNRFSEIPALISRLPDVPDAGYAASLIQAKIAEAGNDSSRAHQYYLAALASLTFFPDTPERQYRQAYLYAMTGQAGEAEKIYRYLLGQKADDLRALLNLSEVCASLGNLKDAEELAQKAVRLYPDSVDARICLKRRNLPATQ